MDVQDELVGQGLHRVRLAGRLDVQGNQEIETRFTAITATTHDKFVIDMSQVNFVASIGIRLLVSCAKANASRGGRFVLASLQPLVRETFVTAGIDNLIPLYADVETAIAELVA
jgi:anti-anti-sigma factor